MLLFNTRRYKNSLYYQKEKHKDGAKSVYETFSPPNFSYTFISNLTFQKAENKRGRNERWEN